MEQMGLRRRAISTISFDTTPHSKPHFEPILHAARLANISPKLSLYLGDDIRDVIAGKGAGMKPSLQPASYGYCGLRAELPQEWGTEYLIQPPWGY